MALSREQGSFQRSITLDKVEDSASLSTESAHLLTPISQGASTPALKQPPPIKPILSESNTTPRIRKEQVSWQDELDLSDKGGEVSSDSVLLKMVSQADLLNKNQRDCRTASTQELEAKKKREEKPKHQPIMVTTEIDDDLILSYDVHPSASCIEFLQMILRQYDGRNHPKSTSIIAPFATHIWTSAGIKTFSDLINIGKNLDPLTGEPYTVSRMRSDLTKATMIELIGRVRERNLTVEDRLNDNDRPKGDIDPISERVLREAWVVGLIVWLPAELGRRCAELHIGHEDQRTGHWALRE